MTLVLRINLSVQAQPFMAFGPMFHYNLTTNNFSWGLEYSIWVSGPTLNQSIDFGFDKSRDWIVFYSEYQTGKIFYGLSVGPSLKVSF